MFLFAALRFPCQVSTRQSLCQVGPPQPFPRKEKIKKPCRPCHGAERQAQNPASPPPRNPRPRRRLRSIPQFSPPPPPVHAESATYAWTQRGSRSPAASSAAPRRPRGPEWSHRSSLRAGSVPSTPMSTRSRGRGPGCRRWLSSPSCCSGASSSCRPRTSGTPTTRTATGSPSTARATRRYGTARQA